MPPESSKLAAIVFDCDGVLLDSNELKTACFREVLQAGGFAAADVARFESYQRASFGTSRYRLFEHFLTWELVQRPPLNRDDLVANYASLLRGRYVLADATPGMREVITACGRDLPLYVASGSDQAELREVLAERGDAAPFRLILGSPTTKVDNLRYILADLAEHHGVQDTQRVVFIGDAEADLTAARGAGTRFVYMDRFSSAQPKMRALATELNLPVIEDLRGLPAVLREFESLRATA